MSASSLHAARGAGPGRRGRRTSERRARRAGSSRSPARAAAEITAIRRRAIRPPRRPPSPSAADRLARHLGGDVDAEALEDGRRDVGREHVAVESGAVEVRSPSNRARRSRSPAARRRRWPLDGDQEVVSAQARDQARQTAQVRASLRRSGGGAGGGLRSTFSVRRGAAVRGRETKKYKPLRPPPAPRRRPLRGSRRAGPGRCRRGRIRRVRSQLATTPEQSMLVRREVGCRRGSRRRGCPG